MADTREVLADAILRTKLWSKDENFDPDDPPPHMRGPVGVMRANATTEAEVIITLMAERNVALVEDDGQHYMAVRYDADEDKTHWTIQHPARCRPNLLACTTNDGVEDYFAEHKTMRRQAGRFKLIEMPDGVLEVEPA